MFCGRATVSTDVGAVVEVIGGTGLVVPPRNPRALAEACVSLLRDPERRERLGAAARARARSNCSPSSRTSRHFTAFTWRSFRTPRSVGSSSTRRANPSPSRPLPRATCLAAGPAPWPASWPAVAPLGRPEHRYAPQLPCPPRRQPDERPRRTRPPGTPGSAEAWDARSEEWLEGRGSRRWKRARRESRRASCRQLGSTAAMTCAVLAPVTKLRRVRGGTPVMCVPRGTSTKPCRPPARTPVKGGPP